MSNGKWQFITGDFPLWFTRGKSKCFSILIYINGANTTDKEPFRLLFFPLLIIVSNIVVITCFLYCVCVYKHIKWHVTEFLIYNFNHKSGLSLLNIKPTKNLYFEKCDVCFFVIINTGHVLLTKLFPFPFLCTVVLVSLNWSALGSPSWIIQPGGQHGAHRSGHVWWDVMMCTFSVYYSDGRQIKSLQLVIRPPKCLCYITALPRSCVECWLSDGRWWFQQWTLNFKDYLWMSLCEIVNKYASLYNQTQRIIEGSRLVHQDRHLFGIHARSFTS